MSDCRSLVEALSLLDWNGLAWAILPVTGWLYISLNLCAAWFADP